MIIYLPSTAWFVIMIASFIACCLQAFHLFTTLFVSNSVRLKKIGLVEASVFGTLLLNMELCCFAASNPMQSFANIVMQSPTELGVLRLMFLLLACLLVGLILSRNVMVLVDFMFSALLLPSVMYMFGGWWILSPVILTVYGLFRTINDLRYDTYRMNKTVTRLSLAEALHAFPDGLLLVSSENRLLLINDMMRVALADLGVEVDWNNASELFDTLRNSEQAIVFDGNLQIEGATGRTYIFARHPMKLLSMNTTCLTAIDVSEQLEIEKQIRDANCELQEANDEIALSMGAISDLADIQANLVMKARVHDIIGQRLSMLHRLVEDGDVSMERIDAIRPALENLVDDLSNISTEIHDDPDILLASIVEAFATAGLEVKIMGALPKRENISKAFIKMVRECSTNAMKHGHAASVNVRFEEDESSFICTVVNHGSVDSNSYVEGTGLRNLRVMMENLGGELSVDTESSFTVRAIIPKSKIYYGVKFDK